MRSGEGPGSDHAFFYGRICPQHGKRRGRRRRCDLFAPFDAAGQVRDGDLEITGNLGVSVAWTSSTELLTCHQSGRWEDPTAGQVMCTGWVTFIKIMREVHFHWHAISEGDFNSITQLVRYLTSMKLISSDLSVGVFQFHLSLSKKQ
ncbi:uncharacterized [Lates japonicus]